MSSEETVVVSQNFQKQFIQIYKEHPALWKIKSKQYTNRNLKNRGNNALVEYSKKFYPNADKNFVCKKIQNMRGAFRTEMKKVEASRRSGSGTDDVYQPHLWYFDLLLFTTDQEIPVESIESVDFDDETQCSDLTEQEDLQSDAEIMSENFDTNNAQVEGTESNSQETEDSTTNNSQTVFKLPSKQIKLRTPNNEKRKRKIGFQQQQQEFMKTCTNVLQEKDAKIDEYHAVGINVASKLQKMDPMQQVLAEALINKILTKGIFKELTRTTDIAEGIVSAPVRTHSYLYDQSSNSTSFTPSPLTSPGSDATQYYENVGQTLQQNF